MGPIAEDALAGGSAQPRAGGKGGRSAVVESLEDIGVGSIAGIVGKYIEYPFDTVKVRLQSQPDRYSGPIDCFRQSIRADGFVNGLYRGITAPLVGAALENSSMFFFERVGRDLALASGVFDRRSTADRSTAESEASSSSAAPLPLSALYMTGAFAGVLTSFVLTPIELVKCKIQAPAVVAPSSSSSSAAAAPLRPLSVIRDVYRAEGLLGFWHGQLGTLIREGGGGAAWFGAKETVSKAFAAHNAAKAGVAIDDDDDGGARRQQLMQQPLPLWQQAVAGAAGGVSYNFLFFPADTIKSRMQTAAIGEAHAAGGARKRFWTEGVAIWRQYGLRGLYRGCGITCLRSAPSSAFIFMVYDGLKQQLDKLH